MTGAQIVAIAITVLAVLGGGLTNVRVVDMVSGIADLHECLHTALHNELEQSMRINKRFDAIDRKLDEILSIAKPRSAPSLTESHPT